MAAASSSSTIRAAGGVVWRLDGAQLLVAVVHRPRYDDWSLPKGKLDKGESELTAAVREVGEEIGSTVAVSRRLTRIAYRYGDARKTVAFFAMRHLGGDFTANDEVDDLRWLTPSQARELLSYRIERGVLDEFEALPVPDSVVVLVRHAKAGKRSQWQGDDTQRPLERTGVAQASRLVPFLGMFGPDAVLTAAPLRCRQTVEPFAAALGVDVQLDPRFSDDDYALAPEAAEAALLALAKPGQVSVVCSQGGTIPGLIETMVRGVRQVETRKGAAWVLSFVDGTLAAADYYPDAAR